MSNPVTKLLRERYFLEKETCWEDIAKRVSKLYDPIYPYIKDMTFIPSSPTLMNACTDGERLGTLSSCFILDVEDSIESIMKSMSDAAQVTRKGGGVGFNWSSLRGASEVVKSTGRNSGGVLSFIGIFDAILNGVIQGGARRGAGMSMLNITHPDILKFIKAKSDENAYTRSNFSVKIHHKFYEILEKDPDRVFKTINIVDGKEKPLLDDKGEEITYKQLWDFIVERAWAKAEPGIFNGDIASERCTCKHINPNVNSNPCSEFTHIPYTSCNLGSVNLTKFINKEGVFDWDRFNEVVRTVVRFMNKVIDKNDFPLLKIKEETLKTRPIGIGCMGLAHLFYQLRLPYNSKEALELARTIIRTMTLTAMEESVKMAKEKDKSFEYFDYKTFMDANKRFWGDDTKELEGDIKKYGIYNSSETSIAPSGTISFIANCSGGIEPIFGLVFSRKIEKGNKVYETVYVVDPLFEEYVDEKLKDKKEKIYKYIAENKGSCQGCSHIPEEDQKIFVVAGDLTAKEHLDLLGAVANVTSLSVSKTINLPENATKEDVGSVFLEAYKKGIIGVTVYRDRCREGILTHATNVKVERPERVTRIMAPKRPQDLPCNIHDIRVGGDRFIVLVGFLNESLYEMFVTKDAKEKIDLDKCKEGIIRKREHNVYDLIIKNGDESVLIEDIGDTFDTMDSSLSRLVSMALRHGVNLQFICEQLEKTKNFSGFSKAAMRVLKKYITEGEKVITGEKCESCDGDLVFAEGCKKCIVCGWSKCA